MASCRNQRGFTLIEIMIVMLIIGLALGMVSLAVGGNSAKEEVRKAAEDLVLEANYLAEEAVLKGETYGLFVEVKTPQDMDNQAAEEWCYHWLRVRDRQWGEIPELAEAKCLPEGVAMVIKVDEKTWEYDPELEYQDPVLGFFPGGDSSGTIDIEIFAEDGDVTDDERVQRIHINPMGDLHWLNQEALAEADAR